MRWFTSDLHFGHKNVIEYSSRPFKSVEEMDNTMIARWNKKVGVDDDVFVLGDFGLAGFGYLSDVLHSLNGNKILVRGNHDGTPTKLRRMGFDVVVEEVMIAIDGYEVVMSHYPIDSSEGLRLHGHIHEKGKPYFVDRQLCVCVELWDYAPVSEKEIRKAINKWVKDGNNCGRRAVRRSGQSDERGDEV